MKILIVDDEPRICQVCERALREAGYEVSTCPSGEQAVPRLQEGWDMIVSDIMMPGPIDGNELLRRARAVGGMDVVLMTGYPSLETTIAALKDGAYDYLIKPLTPDALLAVVRRCDEKRRLASELTQEKKLRADLNEAYIQLARMQKVQETFGQFTSPEVARFILEQPSDFWKRGERRDVTVLFADVRRFTSFAEQISPEEVVRSLNEVFSLFIDAVQKEGGIVNKFIGDGVMALFGAPLPHPQAAEAAARAALRTRDCVQKLAASRELQKLPPLRCGFGINSGEAVAGCLGTKERAEYSVIGNIVNIAARLEEVAAPDQILLGPGTFARLDGHFSRGKPRKIALSGLHEPVPTVELLGFTKRSLES